MREIEYAEGKAELSALCNIVREFVSQEAFEEGAALIQEAMGKYPDSAAPHNLYGILMEKQGNHVMAMKHFRAAWALDPTYSPTRCNLEQLEGFPAKGNCAYDESDCMEEKGRNAYGISYGGNGIGYLYQKAPAHQRGRVFLH